MHGIRRKKQRRPDVSEYTWVLEFAAVAIMTPALLYGLWSMNNLPLV